MKRVAIESMSFRLSVLAKASIRGSDASATTHAYTVIISPACDSDIWKSPAMSDRSPMGMNSDVLKMNVENVSPITGSQPLNPEILLSSVKDADLGVFSSAVFFFISSGF